MKKTITALDTESSGFDGYPIQIGIIKENGKTYKTFVKPSDNWLDNLEWDENSQKVHSIELDYLIKNGTDLETVAREINNFVDGDDVYVDSNFDVKWVNRLFDEVQMKRMFKFIVISDMCSDEFCSHWYGVFNVELKNSALKRHDALNDAILIQRTYAKIASHF